MRNRRSPGGPPAQTNQPPRSQRRGRRRRGIYDEEAESRPSASNTALAESLFLTKRAVEKHINAIFLKLGLADAEDVSKRVKATLMLLAETHDPVDAPCPP